MSSQLPQSEWKVPPKLRIILIGKTGVGKTSAMNVLLGRPALTKSTASSETTECKIEEGKVNGQQLVVIDTPGLMNTERAEEDVRKDIMGCIAAAAPGPHVFLLVMKPEAFSAGDKDTVEIIHKMFGEESKNYTLLLFTCGDRYQPKDDALKKTFIGPYIVGHHSFDNTGKKHSNQVSELLEKINEMVRKNGEKPSYTNEMLRKAQEVKEKEMEKLKGDGPKEQQQVMHKVVESFLSGTVGEPWAGLALAVVGFAITKVYQQVS